MNTSGKGLVASLNAKGQIVVTDTENRSGTTALTATGTTLEAGSDSAAETGALAANQSSFDVYLSDATAAGSSTISTQLGALDSSNLNGVSLSLDSLSSASGAQSALTDINNAISSVAGLRGTLGASMNRLTAATNVINNQIQNLTSAQDNISSADISTEVSNMTKYNVLTQTGISALSQSNQMQQALLKLLQ